MTVDIKNLINQRPVRLAVRPTLTSNHVYIERSSAPQHRSIEQAGLIEMVTHAVKPSLIR